MSIYCNMLFKSLASINPELIQTPATIPIVYWKQVLAITHAKGTYAMFRAILSSAGRKPSAAQVAPARRP